MTNEQFDGVKAFADDVIHNATMFAHRHIMPLTNESKAALRLTAIRVAFVALGVTL